MSGECIVNIGILTSTNPQLRDQLEANGRSDAKPEQLDTEVVVAAPKPRATGNTAPATRYPSMRAALDAHIAADVSSGTLTENDAMVVGKTLDDVESGSTARPHFAAQAYLATIARGTLVDRWA